MILFSVRASWKREREKYNVPEIDIVDNSQKDSYLEWGSYYIYIFTLVHLVDTFIQK